MGQQEVTADQTTIGYTNWSIVFFH